MKVSERTRGTNRILSFIVKPALAQLIIAAAQLIALILRQILIAIPLLAKVLFVLRGQILPTLIVTLDIVFFLGTQTAPIVTPIPSPTRNGQQQNQAKTQREQNSFYHF
jgi:hypothetical protein